MEWKWCGKPKREYREQLGKETSGGKVGWNIGNVSGWERKGADYRFGERGDAGRREDRKVGKKGLCGKIERKVGMREGWKVERKKGGKVEGRNVGRVERRESGKWRIESRRW